MSEQPDFKLPEGMAWGDPVWLDEQLAGRVDPEGKVVAFSLPDGVYEVPVLLDSPNTRLILRTAKENGTLDSHELNMRIGGKAKTAMRYSYSADVSGHPKHTTETTVIETDDPDIIRIFDEGYPKAELLPVTLDRVVKAGLSDRNVTIVTSDPHFVKDGRRAALPYSVKNLAEVFPRVLNDELQHQRAIGDDLQRRYNATGHMTDAVMHGMANLPDDGKTLTVEMETTDDRKVRLTTRDPRVKFAITYARRRDLGTQELWQEMVDSGLGDLELEYAMDRPKEDKIAKAIAEMRGEAYKPKPESGTISVAKILGTFVEETGKLPPKKQPATTPEVPPEIDPKVLQAVENLNDAQLAKLQSAVERAETYRTRQDIITAAAEEVTKRWAREGRKRDNNIKDWAAAVNGTARRMGMTGKAFTEAEAAFTRDAYAELSSQEDYGEMLKAFRPPIRLGTSPEDEYSRCDFCSSDNPVWAYPCEDFVIDTPDGGDFAMDGAWAACERCAMSIEANDRLSLVNRYLRGKPEPFRELLRPWGIRLHNQFFRHRQGARVRLDYHLARGAQLEQAATKLEEAERKAGLRDKRGPIEVMSADHPDAPPEIAARVRETGEVAMMVEDEHGNMHVVAEGDAAVDAAFERRQIAAGYMKHPLLERYFQHIHSSQTLHGLWRNTEAWHALAEKYGMTLAAASSLGIPGKENDYGSMYFEPRMVANWQSLADEQPNFLPGMGLYVTHGLHDSVPYLWTSKVDELAGEPDLPPHNITRGLAPHPAMFWSFEAAMGEPDARIDWMLVMETRRGYEVWFPIANDEKRDGTVMLSGALIPYGARWPDVAQGEKQSMPEFLLKRLSFLNSKYTETPHVRAHRAIRREVQRNQKPYHHPVPDDMGAFVIHLRAPEPKPARSEIAGPGREINRQHCWWRRAHTRILYRDKPNERATWVRASLMGDPNLPLIRTTIVVDR